MAAALGAGLCAQVPLQGFMYNWDRPALGDALSLFVRWGPTAENVLMRVDRSDYPEWGANATGQTRIQGFMTWINDANDATRESFNLVAFDEDVANPDFPGLATPVLNVGPIQMPPTGTTPGNVAWRLSATLTAPVTLNTAGDVFVGLGLPAMVSAVQPFDGLFVGEVNSDPTSFVWDIPGPTGQLGGGVGQESYICYVPTGQPARYLPASVTSLEQLAFDVHVANGAGGVPIAVTSQTNFPTSNVLGTSDFLSGSHPDIARGDNIGFAVTAHSAQVGAASAAFVVLGFALSPFGSIPMNQLGLDAGSTGNLCVDFASGLTFFILLNGGQANSLANMVEGQFVLPLSASDRALIQSQAAGFDIIWQGFALDSTSPTSLRIHATGCARQHLK